MGTLLGPPFPGASLVPTFARTSEDFGTTLTTFAGAGLDATVVFTLELRPAGTYPDDDNGDILLVLDLT